MYAVSLFCLVAIILSPAISATCFEGETCADEKILNSFNMASNIHKAADKAALSPLLGEWIKKVANDAIDATGKFNVAVSGGSLAGILSTALSKDDVDFSKWEVFFADERYVALDHEDSNFKGVNENFFQKVGIAKEQVHVINPDIPLEEAAAAYEKDLVETVGETPALDLILLGMGPDGHTCSLFPNHPLLDEDSKWVASLTDSPKPPPSRLTLTLKAVNIAKKVAFVCAGAGKADMLHKIFETETKRGDIPSKLVQPGEAHWFIDDAAATKLSKI